MYNGMITIYKEAGYTSSDAVARLRRILRMRKIGHTGTLDPAAEGVLPVCLGSATRLCDLIADRDKEYETVLRLGTVTDTEDMTGTVLTRISDEEVREKVTDEAFRETAQSFIGPYAQIPPMYAAIKVNGRKLYELAREGKTIERKPRQVQIFRLEILECSLPLARLRVTCSKGTYIRSLCRDIGDRLGVGGCMEHLVRTRVGNFTLPEAVRLDELQEMSVQVPEKIAGLIRPVDSFFDGADRRVVLPEFMGRLLNGNPLLWEQTRAFEDSTDPGSQGDLVLLYDETGVFYALYRKAEEDRLVPVKMFLPR